MGKNTSQKRIERQELDAKKFNWQYITHYHINTHNKLVNYIYDFSWMIFSDEKVLIKKVG